MELQQHQSINQKQTQEQTLSHAQLQSLQVLAATTQELQQQLTKELQQNPVLEVIANGHEVLVGDPMQRPTEDEHQRREFAATATEYDENLGDAAGVDATGDDRMDYTMLPTRDFDSEDRLKYYFDSLTTTPTMLDRLQEQLQDEAGNDKELYAAAQTVLGNLDDKGYLKATDEEIAAISRTSLTTAQKAVALVQSFEPTGIGARTPSECLLLQLKSKGMQNTLAWNIVDNHLEDLAHNRIPQIAKALHKDISDVYEAIEQIRELDPFPGRGLSTDTAPMISPEATVSKAPDGSWRITMNRGNYPQLAIQPRYSEMAEDKKTPAETRSYLKNMISTGNQLIKALEQRRSTIVRITECIVELQNDFLEYGPSKLHPMVMADIAAMLSLHETTISRAIANKYLQTPQGLFEYKYFFTAGFNSSSDGEELSSRAIRQKIRELIMHESADKPLSDQKIAEMLSKDGLDVARRTVAKYREAEGIPATNLRRIHM
ncbi:MAG: RNA polymerase factor sigma-54 [Victivallales bacterium]|nr:RNA polymerase factor sigma-54 [Victivallales bacterium]